MIGCWLFCGVWVLLWELLCALFVFGVFILDLFTVNCLLVVLLCGLCLTCLLYLVCLIDVRLFALFYWLI